MWSAHLKLPEKVRRHLVVFFSRDGQFKHNNIQSCMDFFQCFLKCWIQCALDTPELHCYNSSRFSPNLSATPPFETLLRMYETFGFVVADIYLTVNCQMWWLSIQQSTVTHIVPSQVDGRCAPLLTSLHPYKTPFALIPGFQRNSILSTVLLMYPPPTCDSWS